MDEEMNCKFCNSDWESKRSLASHQKVCKLNPNRFVPFESVNVKGRKGWFYKEGTSKKSEKIRKDEEVFVENSTYARHLIKDRVLKQNLIPYICSICSIGPVWMNKEMPLILDHINGINNDNRLSNLRFVCSNCDCQLETYKSKNKKKKTGE